MGETREQRDFREEYAFHRREWRVQRIGWAVLAGVLVLALLGLFGNGPLSAARRASTQAGVMEYQRYVRRGVSTPLTIVPAAAAPGPVRVAVPLQYLQAFEVERVMPEPRAVRADSGHLTYEFTLAAGGMISFQLLPRQIGARRAAIAIGTAPALEIRQFVYP